MAQDPKAKMVIERYQNSQSSKSNLGRSLARHCRLFFTKKSKHNREAYSWR